MTPPAPSSPVNVCLPMGRLIEQAEVQRLLDEHFGQPDRLAAALDELARWSESVGYFDHLGRPNAHLQFDDSRTGVPLRLQVNTSRLGYRPPEGARAPACPLCFENIGTPGKERLRVFEFALVGTEYFAHLTPFPLRPGHFVVNTRVHEPMRIGERGLRETAALLDRVPGWLAASNSDVEWAGASILAHHHVQLFRALELPVESARAQRLVGDGDTRVEILDWHCPVARIGGSREGVLRAAADAISRWKQADSGRATCNYLMRQRGGEDWHMHLFFRHPDHRTPPELQAIKSEGIGIIEMAGEVIVPPLAGCDSDANHEYFARHGAEIVRGIISGNAPWPLFHAMRPCG